MITEADDVAVLATQIGMFQYAFNVILMVAGGFGGYVMKNISSSQKQSQERDRDLADKVHAIEVLVAGQYVTKDAHDKLQDALFRKLDNIESKIDAVPCKNK